MPPQPSAAGTVARRITLVLLALVVSLAGAVLPATTARAQTTVTPLPQIPLSSVTAPGAVTGTAAGGEPALFWVSSGVEAALTVTDARTGVRLTSHPMPNAGGSWTLTRHPSGDIYIGTYGQGRLYRYSPATDTLTDLGQPIAGETFIWSTTVDENGLIFGGTGQNGGHVFSYNPETGAFRDYGPWGNADSPVIQRGLAAGGGTFWVGSGAVPALTEVDIATGARTNIELPDLNGQTYVMDLDLRGDLLFVRASTSGAPQPLFVWDTKARTWIDKIDAAAGLRMSEISPDGAATYFVRNGTLHRYDLASRTWSATSFTGLGDVRAFGWLDLGDPAWPGKTLVMTNYRGTVWHWNPTTDRSASHVADVVGAPAAIRSMAEGPDERVYFGSYLAGGLASYDPKTNTSEFIAQIPQAESLTTHDGAVYAGTYPRAEVWRYHPGEPLVAGVNPRPVLNLYDEGQSRPWAMTSAGRYLAVGTVPHNGAMGGLLALLDTTTGQHWSVKVAGGQSVVGLVHRDGILYGTTSAFGGSGAPRPTTLNAHVFAYDLATRTMLWEKNPVAGEGGLGEIAFDKQGMLWTAGPMTTHRIDPADGRLVATKNYGAYPWDTIEYSWVGSRVWVDPYDGKVMVASQGAVWQVDPTTLARARVFRPASYAITTNAGLHYTARETEAWKWQMRPAVAARATASEGATRGGTLKVELTGFGPGEPVTLRLRPDATGLVDTVTDASGRAFVTVDVPLAAQVGGGAVEVERPLTRGIVRVPVTVGAEACTRTVTGNTGRLLVRADEIVCLDRATVRGGVSIRGEGQLFVRDSTVQGSVHAAGADAVLITGSTIKGDVDLTGVRDRLLRDNVITGSVVG